MRDIMKPESQEPISFGRFECEVCKTTMQAVLVDHAEDDGYDHDLFYRCPQCSYEQMVEGDLEGAIGWMLTALHGLMHK